MAWNVSRRQYGSNAPSVRKTRAAMSARMSWRLDGTPGRLSGTTARNVVSEGPVIHEMVIGRFDGVHADGWRRVPPSGLLFASYETGNPSMHPRVFTSRGIATTFAPAAHDCQ